MNGALGVCRHCKDIPDRPILEFLYDLDGFGNRWTGDPTVPWAARSVFQAMPWPIPVNLGVAKMRRLIKRGLVDGCCCGCRGDFELTELGRKYVEYCRERDLALAQASCAKTEDLGRVMQATCQPVFDPRPARYLREDDALADMREGTRRRSVPPLEMRDGKVCLRDEYRDAPYEVSLHFLPGSFEVARP